MILESSCVTARVPLKIYSETGDPLREEVVPGPSDSPKALLPTRIRTDCALEDGWHRLVPRGQDANTLALKARLLQHRQHLHQDPLDEPIGRGLYLHGYGKDRSTHTDMRLEAGRESACSWGVSPQIYCLMTGVFPIAKVSKAARELGVQVEFVKNDRNLVAELADMPARTRPSLIIVDLNHINAKPLTLIPRLRAKLKKSVSIIGLVSPVQGELKMRGIKAGCDTVLSCSAFSQSLFRLLRRYRSS